MVQVILILCLVALVALVITLALKLRTLNRRLGPVLDVEKEAASIKARVAAEISERHAQAAAAEAAFGARAAQSQAEVARAQAALVELAALKERAAAELVRMKGEIEAIEGTLEEASVGIYRPFYNFDTSDEYKRRLEAILVQKKAMVRDKRAATCSVQWSVGNSEKEGARMQDQYTKILLRAFNGECDAAIAKVAWNNATKTEERIRRAFAGINKLGTVMKVSLSSAYLDLSLAELRLTHEYAVKRQEEAEEQRRIKEQMREEEKAQRELLKAQQDAEAEEARYQKALEKARADMSKAQGARLASLTSKIQELEAALAEAHKRKERAMSMAQQTRAGHVYVISNIGSFGDRVVKIGMTRRLEPTDRIKELGDASVPFAFDVHALIYSDDAPALENALHRRFTAQRVNLVNHRKEFFELDLVEIEAVAIELGFKIQITRLAEAREYRETQALRRESLVVGVARTRGVAVSA